MPHKSNRTLRNVRGQESPAVEARRLRFQYYRLRRLLTALHGRNDAEVESNALRDQVDHIARNLGSIPADSVHVVESKLKVALDLANGSIGKTSHNLLTSALADLHYLALLSRPWDGRYAEHFVARARWLTRAQFNSAPQVK